MISTVYSAIKTRISTVLGSTYQELTHVFDLSKNRFAGASLGYGLLPASSNETSGETMANTYLQGFKIILTDSYISDSLSDSELIAKTITMLEKLEGIFKDLVVQKCGSPANVQSVLNFAVDSAVIAKEDKVIVVEASFDVRLKISLV